MTEALAKINILKARVDAAIARAEQAEMELAEARAERARYGDHMTSVLGAAETRVAELEADVALLERQVIGRDEELEACRVRRSELATCVAELEEAAKWALAYIECEEANADQKLPTGDKLRAAIGEEG